MASTTRKRWGLGGGGKRGGGGGGRKNPTKTRKTTTTFTTTTTKDAEKKKPCVDFLSLFFFSLSRGAPSKTKGTLRRERVRAGSGRCSGLQEQRGRDKRRPSLATEVSRRSLSPRARAVGFVFSFSLSLTQLSNFLSLSLSQRARADSGVLYASSSGRF